MAFDTHGGLSSASWSGRTLYMHERGVMQIPFSRIENISWLNVMHQLFSHSIHFLSINLYSRLLSASDIIGVARKPNLIENSYLLVRYWIPRFTPCSASTPRLYWAW